MRPPQSLVTTTTAATVPRPAQPHSGGSCPSSHTLGPVSRSQVAVPSAPGVLTELEQTENDSIENRLSQNFATIPLSALSHSASGTQDGSQPCAAVKEERKSLRKITLWWLLSVPVCCRQTNKARKSQVPITWIPALLPSFESY